MYCYNNRLLPFLLTCLPLALLGQNYDSYKVGNTVDIVTQPKGGICLMGGATEDDNAMRWFLEQASGGDILVLRTSGSDGYNDYMYSDLGINVNSVETVVCNNASSADEPYIIDRIAHAEAIWFAGGDQWTYISYWRSSPVDSAINAAIENRNIVIGGTSAGMAIQGKYYFSAENGTVTSAQSLQDPYNASVTVDSTSFIKNDVLSDLITDTHFDNPDRQGRIFAFLARVLTDQNAAIKAIACDEYTALCIDSSGMGRAFGGYPTYDDYVYFIAANCEVPNNYPETCTAGNPLTWNRGQAAVKVCRLNGDESGSQQFDLNNWTTTSNAVWQNWSASNGVLTSAPSVAPDCSTLSLSSLDPDNITVYPNPATESVHIRVPDNFEGSIVVRNILGQEVEVTPESVGPATFELRVSQLSAGTYTVTCIGNDAVFTRQLRVK